MIWRFRISTKPMYPRSSLNRHGNRCADPFHALRTTPLRFLVIDGHLLEPHLRAIVRVSSFSFDCVERFLYANGSMLDEILVGNQFK